MINAYAATEPGGKLNPFEYDPGPLLPGQVEVAVSYCGLCHSDLSMLNNDWGMSQYPLVPGHEVAGTIVALGEGVTHLAVGQRVGVGWFSRSCMTCPTCLGGDHNLCASAESTIVGRYGGFADKIRVSHEWATPLPDALDDAVCGPLFCGGITVYGPMEAFGVKPTDRVGVVGIGGLGHLALQFLSSWGCDVTAFSSNAAKSEEAMALGAHRVVDSRDPAALAGIARSLDFLISTVNVPLDWGAYLGTLAPKGRLHLVGAVPEITLPVMALLGGQQSVSGSPLGSPASVRRMLDFCVRHGIAPVTEEFPMSEINEAFAHLHAGKARYRVVLKAGS